MIDRLSAETMLQMVSKNAKEVIDNPNASHDDRVRAADEIRRLLHDALVDPYRAALENVLSSVERASNVDYAIKIAYLTANDGLNILTRK